MQTWDKDKFTKKKENEAPLLTYEIEIKKKEETKYRTLLYNKNKKYNFKNNLISINKIKIKRCLGLRLGSGLEKN